MWTYGKGLLKDDMKRLSILFMVILCQIYSKGLLKDEIKRLSTFYLCLYCVDIR